MSLKIPLQWQNKICAVVDSESTTAQFRFFITKHLIIPHLQWNIAFLLLLILSHQQHKLDITTLNTSEYFFWNDKFHLCYFWFCLENSTNCIFYCKKLNYTICIGRVLLCCCWVRLNNTTNLSFHCKTFKNISFAMVNYLCVVVDSDSTTAQFGFLIAKHLKIGHL